MWHFGTIIKFGLNYKLYNREKKKEKNYKYIISKRISEWQLQGGLWVPHKTIAKDKI